MYCTIYCSPFLMKLEFSRQSFEKYTNIKFHENPSNGRRVATFGQADRQTDGRTDMAKLIVVFRNFAKSSKNQHTHAFIRQQCAEALLSTHADISYPQCYMLHFFVLILRLVSC